MFSYFSFRFFLVGNAIACGYSIASLPFVSKLVEGYILDVLDLVCHVFSLPCLATGNIESLIFNIGSNVLNEGLDT